MPELPTAGEIFGVRLAKLNERRIFRLRWAVGRVAPASKACAASLAQQPLPEFLIFVQNHLFEVGLKRGHPVA